MSTRNERRKAQHVLRKHRETYWRRQRKPLAIVSKGRVKVVGKSFHREMRDGQFMGGITITLETNPLGNLNSTSTRVVTGKFKTVKTGKTWMRKYV